MLFQWTVRSVIYRNSTIIASSAVIFSFLVGFIMATKLRKQIILRKQISHRFIPIYSVRNEIVIFLLSNNFPRKLSVN